MGIHLIDGNEVELSEVEENEIILRSPVIQFYKDRISPFMGLLDREQKGELLEMIVYFGITREMPESNDKLVMAAFQNIKQGMDYDKPKFIRRTLNSRNNGKKNKTKKEPSGTQKNPVGTQWEPTVPYTDTDTETETDTETDTDTDTDRYTDTERGTGETNNTIETIEEAQTIFVNSCSKHHAPNNCMNYLIFKIQEEYSHGVFYTAALLDDMARNAEQLCNDIKRGRA